ncbi:MAG: M28 family peptidase [Anaerolineales bacterium]|nr:M28 family peptidase [Anaerolineales bacterium]
MERKQLEAKAEEYLTHLCRRIPNRRVGAEGNRMATEWFAEKMRAAGFAVEMPWFNCIDWQDEGAHLLALNGEVFEVFSSPYTLGCSVLAPLVVVRTVDQLAASHLTGMILMLSGEIAAEQVMPKNFPFYNPEHHQQIVRLLEEKAPLAIITATGRNPELAGGLYPFPMIEDGDFDIPSVYMKDVDGEKLAQLPRQQIALTIDSTRIQAKGCNVIARKPAGDSQRVVLCAHIDAKDNTPGALDNGTGVVTLALLAELLADYSGPLGVELLAFNGEDHYSAQGQKEYLKSRLTEFSQIALAINTDVAGYVQGNSAFSLYGVSDQISSLVREVMGQFASFQEGEQWYQSDHSVFIQNGCPAVAITSDQFMRLSTEVTHTPADDLDLVDYGLLVDVALALEQVVRRLNAVI